VKEGNMPGKDKIIPNKEPTLEDIEKHLKRQDRQIVRETWLTISIFGGSIIMVAVGLYIGRVLSPAIFYWQYIFLLVCGFGIMTWALRKSRKIKD
jgi:fatty acid desaturase